jgi:hypothetical protein
VNAGARTTSGRWLVVVILVVVAVAVAFAAYILFVVRPASGVKPGS